MKKSILILIPLLLLFSCDMADTRQQEEETGTISFQVTLPQTMAAEDSNARFLLAETSAMEVMVLPAATFDNPLYSGLGTAPPSQTLVEGLRLLDGALSTVIRPADYSTDADGVISAAHSFQLPPGDYRVIVGSFTNVGATELPDWSAVSGFFAGPVSWGISSTVTVLSNVSTPVSLVLSPNLGTSSVTKVLMNRMGEDFSYTSNSNSPETIIIHLTTFSTIGDNLIGSIKNDSTGASANDFSVTTRFYDMQGNELTLPYTETGPISNDPDYWTFTTQSADDELLVVLSLDGDMATGKALQTEVWTNSDYGHLAGELRYTQVWQPATLTVNVGGMILPETGNIQVHLVPSGLDVGTNSTGGIPNNDFMNNNAANMTSVDLGGINRTASFSNLMSGTYSLVIGAFDQRDVDATTETWYYDQLPMAAIYNYGPSSFIVEENITIIGGENTQSLNLIVNYAEFAQRYGGNWGMNTTSFDLTYDTYHGTATTVDTTYQESLVYYFSNFKTGLHQLTINVPNGEAYYLEVYDQNGANLGASFNSTVWEFTLNSTAPTDSFVIIVGFEASEWPLQLNPLRGYFNLDTNYISAGEAPYNLGSLMLEQTR